MPKASLSSGRRALLTLLLGLSLAGLALAGPALRPRAQGDAAVGRALYTGADYLQNGGPPCFICHNMAGIDALGGGELGPDLTQAVSKFGASGLRNTLEALPFPVMMPVYQGRPLTAAELADLLAFFEAAPGLPITRPTAELALLAVGGFFAFIGLLHLAWSRRLLGVRRPFVRRALRQQGRARR